MTELQFETVELSSSASDGMAGERVKGYCEICGKKAYHHWAYRCDEHKSTATNSTPKRKPGRPKGSGNSPGAAGTRSSNSSAPNAGAWQKTISKLLLIVTSFVAIGIVNRAQIIDESEELADELSLQAEEANDIARPLARVISKTSVARKYGGVIVDNDDLIDAGIALTDYMKRVRQVMARIERIHQNRDDAYRQQRAQPRAFAPQPTGENSYGPTGQNETGGSVSADDGGEFYGPPAGVYAYPPFQDFG